MLNYPEILALCASFFFALALVLTQFGLKYMSPRQGALVSIPMLTLLFWMLAPALLDSKAWNSNAAAVFLGVGLIYPVVVTLLTYEANRLMGPGVAGALGNLAPLFAVAAGMLLFNEFPRLVQVVGIATIVLGVVLLSIRRGRVVANAWPYWAAALPIGASAIRGVAQPVTKIALALWPSPYAAALFGFTTSSIVLAVVATLRDGRWWERFSRKGVMWFCCVGLCNGLAVLSLYAALAKGSVILVAPLAATYPLIALILSALIFRNERIERAVLAGVVMIVVGVVMIVGT